MKQTTKKWYPLAAALLAVLMMVSAVSCVLPGTPDGEQSPSVSTGETESETKGSESLPSDHPSTPSDDTNKQPVFQKTATIEKTVLVDEKDIKITATSLEYSDMGYAYLHIECENNAGKKLKFQCSDSVWDYNYGISVNGYMVDDEITYGIPALNVEAGQKASEKISLDLNRLMFLGIESFKEFTMIFRVQDENYEDYFISAPVILKTSDTTAQKMKSYQGVLQKGDSPCEELNYTLFFYSPEEKDPGQGIRILSQALLKNKKGENMLLLEVQNTSSFTVGFDSTAVRVNGLRIGEGVPSNKTIFSGKTAVVCINLDWELGTASWAEYGISQIGKVGVEFDGYVGKEKIFSGMTTELAVSGADGTFDNTGEGYEKNGIRVIKKGVFYSEYWKQFSVHLLFENATNRPVAIEALTITVNGKEFHGRNEYAAYSGESVMAIMYCYADELELESIDEVKSATLKLKLYDQNGTIEEITLELK